MTELLQPSRMPEGLEIKVRDRKFHLSDEILRADWLAEDAFKTAFFNALSLGFPIGEKSFIDSVRAYFGTVTDAKLKNEMRAFFGQEGMHRREHLKYNELLCKLRDYDLIKVEKIWKRRVAQINSYNDPMLALAATVAGEHFTAVFAENLLKGWQLQKLPEEMKELWLWHAREELEHKSVAFDVFNNIGGTYCIRRKMMISFTYHYITDLFTVILYLLHHDKQLWKWKTLSSGIRFLFGKKGFLRTHRVQYNTFFNKNFHPWDHDNQNLLSRAQDAN